MKINALPSTCGICQSSLHSGAKRFCLCCSLVLFYFYLIIQQGTYFQFLPADVNAFLSQITGTGSIDILKLLLFVPAIVKQTTLPRFACTQ